MVHDFEVDSTFKIDDTVDLPREVLRERVMTRAARLAELLSTDSAEDAYLRMKVLSIIDPGFMTRMGVHFGLFMGAVTGSGTDDQAKEWIAKGALSLKGFVGCFGMTEMGHGSNVSGIETTATFDSATDEFIVHSPTLTATKWWIGGAAETATHSCVFAKLIVGDKAYGVKSFIVQLRNPKTFSLMPGVKIGDMGGKMGRNCIDNGWIRFDQVRIPRTNMLMRYSSVSKDGKVTESLVPQLSYGALIHGRMAMIRESSDALKKALTIAVRFACQRQQFASKEAESETFLMDYQSHQMRLIPLLAKTYALIFADRAIKAEFDQCMVSLRSANPNDPGIHKIIRTLKNTHGVTAGLKAAST